MKRILFVLVIFFVLTSGSVAAQDESNGTEIQTDEENEQNEQNEEEESQPGGTLEVLDDMPAGSQGVEYLISSTAHVSSVDFADEKYVDIVIVTTRPDQITVTQALDDGRIAWTTTQVDRGSHMLRYYWIGEDAQQIQVSSQSSQRGSQVINPPGFNILDLPPSKWDYSGILSVSVLLGTISAILWRWVIIRYRTQNTIRSITEIPLHKIFR